MLTITIIVSTPRQTGLTESYNLILGNDYCNYLARRDYSTGQVNFDCEHQLALCRMWKNASRGSGSPSDCGWRDGRIRCLALLRRHLSRTETMVWRNSHPSSVHPHCSPLLQRVCFSPLLLCIVELRHHLRFYRFFSITYNINVRYTLT